MPGDPAGGARAAHPGQAGTAAPIITAKRQNVTDITSRNRWIAYLSHNRRCSNPHRPAGRKTMMNKRIHNPAAVLVALLVLAMVFAIAGAVTSQSAPISAKTDRFALATDQLCEAQTWPHVSAACLSWEAGTSARKGFVRTITVEQRDVANQTSVLMRVPVSLTAQR